MMPDMDGIEVCQRLQADEETKIIPVIFITARTSKEGKIEGLGVGAVGTMAPFVAEYLLRRTDIVGSLPAAYVIAGIVSIPVWVRVSRRFGGRDHTTVMHAVKTIEGKLGIERDFAQAIQGLEDAIRTPPAG